MPDGDDYGGDGDGDGDVDGDVDSDNAGWLRPCWHCSAGQQRVQQPTARADTEGALLEEVTCSG